MKASEMYKDVTREQLFAVIDASENYIEIKCKEIKPKLCEDSIGCQPILENGEFKTKFYRRYMKQTFDYPIFCLDFDGTIVDEYQYPDCGPVKENSVEVINRQYENGAYIIIWTCRQKPEAIKIAKTVLKEAGIKYHKFNENNPDLLLRYNCDSRKLGCDLYFDDKSMCGDVTWLNFENFVNNNFNYPGFPVDAEMPLRRIKRSKNE